MTNGELVIKNIFLSKEFKRRGNTLEFRNAVLIFDPKEKYIDYGDSRPSSRIYIENELDWYLSQDLSIKGHKGIENNPIWKECATENEGKVNSNYGYIVFNKELGNSQFKFAVDKLIEDKQSRQSVIIYNKPEMHIMHNDNIHARRDFTCTMHTQHFVEEDNSLTYIVNMRSNDAVFGLQNDYAWHRYVYFQMLEALSHTNMNIKVGKIIWNAGSLHVYERHFDLLKKIIAEYKFGKK